MALGDTNHSSTFAGGPPQPGLRIAEMPDRSNIGCV